MPTNKKPKEIFKVIGIILIILVAWKLTTTAISNTDINSSSVTGVDSMNNSKRNAFISGCESESKKALKDIYTNTQITDYCRCSIAKLEQKYPDFLTNDKNINYILKNGYSKEDTDLLVQCDPAV